MLRKNIVISRNCSQKENFEKLSNRKKINTIPLFNKFILVNLFLLYCLAPAAFGANVTIHWQANPEPDISHYVLYYGTKSRQYTDSVGNIVGTNYTVTDLQNGLTYYFAVTAVDLAGQESALSDEVMFKIDGGSPISKCNDEKNVVINGAIEDGDTHPTGWEINDWVSDGSGAATNSSPGYWDDAEAHSGQNSLKITNETGSNVYWAGQLVQFEKPYPRTLTLGGWAKGNNVGPNAWINGYLFKIVFADGSYQWFHPDELQFPTGNFNWQLKQITKTWTKDIIAVMPFACLYETTGTMWFDDIFITTGKEPLVYNSSMDISTEAPLGWEINDWVSDGSGAATNSSPGYWDDAEAHSGQNSLKITNETGSNVYWAGQLVQFEKPYPRTLTLGGWAKGNNVGPNAWINGYLFKIVFADGSYQWFHPDELQFPTGNFNWQLKQITKTWTKDIIAVMPFACLYETTGTMWFDDVEITVGE